MVVHILHQFPAAMQTVSYTECLNTHQNGMFMELISCDMAGTLQNCCHLNTHSVNTHTIMLKLTLLFKATHSSGLLVHTGSFDCFHDPSDSEMDSRLFNMCM